MEINQSNECTFENVYDLFVLKKKKIEKHVALEGQVVWESEAYKGWGPTGNKGPLGVRNSDANRTSINDKWGPAQTCRRRGGEPLRSV